MSNLNNLSELLEIADAEYEDLLEEEENHVQLPALPGPIVKTDERLDYEKTRKIYDTLVKKGQEALDGALAVANNEESARAYEVVAKMIDSMGNLTDKIYNLHKKVLETTGNAPTPQTFNVDKAVFVGTASDLLDSIEDRKKVDVSTQWSEDKTDIQGESTTQTE